MQLKYGRQQFSCNIHQATVLKVDPPVPSDGPEALIRQSLDHPLGTPPLNQIIEPGEQVVIVTSDITRYTGSEYYLPILIDALNDCGIPDTKICVVIALGIHRKQTEAEHRKILGAAYRRVEVVDHDCDDPDQLTNLGTTRSGIPVNVNRRVAEADRIIVTGTVGFHYFAGYSGGRKGLVPGVASRETCMATHFSVFNPPEVGGKHPNATTGQLEGNPVHALLLEAAHMIDPDFTLNTVLSPAKEVLGVFSGEMETAHKEACTMVNRLYRVSLQKPADLAIVSCGGHPKDINFIQSHKALHYGVNVLRDKGTIILLAACPDGFGNKTFFDWFRHQDLDAFETALRDHYEINGQTAHATLDKARRYRVILVSGLSREQTERMGMEKAEGLKAALSMVQPDLPEKAEVVIIPDGGTVLAEVSADHNIGG